MSYASQTVELHLAPPTRYYERRENYLCSRKISMLCVEEMQKFVVLPQCLPEIIWLTVTTEPLEDAVDLRLGGTLSNIHTFSTQTLSIRFPSGRCRRQLVWSTFTRLIEKVLLADPGARVAYAYVEYEDA